MTQARKRRKVPARKQSRGCAAVAERDPGESRIRHRDFEARITHLSYARDCRSRCCKDNKLRIIAARQMIVEGAVACGDALEQLSRKQVVTLDEERKAAMVSNLLVVLCGNRDAQPIVNSGSIY